MYPQLGLGPKAFEQQLLNTTDCFLYMLYAKGKPHIIPTITLCKFARLEAIDSIFLPQKLMVSNITQTKQLEKKNSIQPLNEISKLIRTIVIFPRCIIEMLTRQDTQSNLFQRSLIKLLPIPWSLLFKDTYWIEGHRPT